MVLGMIKLNYSDDAFNLECCYSGSYCLII